MPKWEYRIVQVEIDANRDYTEVKVTASLNILGREGWEVAGTVQDGVGQFAKIILKRPLETAIQD